MGGDERFEAGWHWVMPWFDGRMSLQTRYDWDNCVLIRTNDPSSVLVDADTMIAAGRVRVGEWRRVPSWDESGFTAWACRTASVSEGSGNT